MCCLIKPIKNQIKSLFSFKYLIFKSVPSANPNTFCALTNKRINPSTSTIKRTIKTKNRTYYFLLNTRMKLFMKAKLTNKQFNEDLTITDNSPAKVWNIPYFLIEE